jgi:hypothetical protein
MPISLDLDHIMGPFRSLARRDLTTIAEIFERLGLWLQNRVKKADQLDQASRSFPVIRFYNEAVTAWVDEIQHGALAPPPSFGDQLSRIGRAFVYGIERIPESVREAQILPRFLDTVDAALLAVLGSLTRFEIPSADTFDPRLRTAGDLFGEMALIWRAVVSSKEQIVKFLFGDVLGAKLVLEASAGGGAGSDGGGGAAKASLGIAETLDGVARYIVGGLLALAALPELVGSVWRALSISFRAQILTTFAEYEALGYDLRRALVDAFYVSLLGVVEDLTSLLSVAEAVILDLVEFWGRFARIYTSLLLTDLAIIVKRLTGWLDDVVMWLLNKIVLSFEGILRFDLTPIIMTILGGVPGYILSRIAPVPTFTVADLASGVARTLVATFIAGAIAVLMAVDTTNPLPVLPIFQTERDDTIDRLLALGRALDILLTPPYLGSVKKTVPAAPPPFPNIYDAWFKTTAAPVIQEAFKALGDKLPGEISDVLNVASSVVQAESYAFDERAAQSAAGLSAARIAGLAQQADSLSNLAFGDEVARMREKVEKGRTDLVAANFERWLAFGGIELIAEFLPQYIRSMLDAWREQELDGTEITILLEQTSPEILIKKAQLARARMKTLTIKARGQDLTDPLVDQIGASFSEQISLAYTAGDEAIRKLAPAAKAA